jgi:hypothetical protein
MRIKPFGYFYHFSKPTNVPAIFSIKEGIICSEYTHYGYSYNFLEKRDITHGPCVNLKTLLFLSLDTYKEMLSKNEAKT